MPRLLERDDVMQTAVNLGRAEKVWSEQLVTGSGDMTFKLPEGGTYQVVLVKMNSSVQEERGAKKRIPVKSISDASGQMSRISLAMARGSTRRARPKSG